MRMVIDLPRGFSDLGKRDVQQDALYPSVENFTKNDNVFVVCDGMGGHMSSEVASNIVVNFFHDNCAKFQKGRNIAEVFKQLLETAWCELDKCYDEDYGDRQMGTTLAFLCFTERGYLAAHIGDSRIYHIRPSAIADFVYKSVDHSQVAELLEEGVMSQMESLSYNNRNILNKAMLPLMRYEADLFDGTDVRAGDYFMLCTDGVLEHLTDEMIKFVFSEYRSTEEIVELLHLHCSKLSKDNNTCVVIPIMDVDDTERDVMRTETCKNISSTVWKDDDLLRETMNQQYKLN